MAEKVDGEIVQSKNELKTTTLAKIKSFSVDTKKIVSLTVAMTFVEIATSVKLLTALNTDVTIIARRASGQKLNLGVFKNAGQSFDNNGNATIKFKAMCSDVNLDKISSLMQDEEEVFQIMFKAVLPDEE